MSDSIVSAKKTAPVENLKKTSENKTEGVNKSKTIAETDRDKLDKKFSKEKSKLN